MSAFNVVGRMAVVKGENILNNYAMGAGVPLGTVCVLAASIINIFMVFVEEAKSKPQQKKTIVYSTSTTQILKLTSC